MFGLAAGLVVVAAQSSSPLIQFTPTEGLMSDPVATSISGLTPGSRVVVDARMELAGRWHSHATFIADRRGEVRLGRDRPVEGTYGGADPMGLFWGMEPEPTTGGVSSGAPDVRQPVITTVDVARDGVTLAAAPYKRWFARPGVRISDVRDAGLVGQLFEPAGDGRHPGILVLGGSQGGIDPYVAAAFANHGYVALALAYFRDESLPRELVNIPMEYFQSATRWLQRHPSVDPKRLAVYGKSRGSEAALLLATIEPAYRVVIAAAPSSVSGAGVGPQHATEPAWTFRGEAIPFAPNDLTVATLRAGVDVAGGSIPVERSRGAVLLVSGGADTISRPGASTLMGDLVIDRLRRSKHRYPSMHLSYPDAGHSLGMLILPGPMASSGGGSPEGNVRAGMDSTPKIFAFLRRNLD